MSISVSACRCGRSADSFPLLFFNATAPTGFYTLSLHDALPISIIIIASRKAKNVGGQNVDSQFISTKKFRSNRRNELRSEEHTSELQSRGHLVCRLLLEKKKEKKGRSDAQQVQLRRMWGEGGAE